MKLTSIDIHGYKKFRAKEKLRLDCRLVALLGPNEAGKSSILDALQSLNSTTAFRTTGPAQDISRGDTFSSSHAVIEATLLIEERDRKHLAAIPEAKDVRWFTVKKFVDGKLAYETIPSVTRDLPTRMALLEKLKLTAHQTDTDDTNPTSQKAQLLAAIVDVLAAIPDPNSENLSDAAIEKLRTLASLFSKQSDRQWKDLVPALTSLANDERKPNPRETTTKTLERRLPRFVPFDAQDRNLQVSYDMNTYFGKQPSPPPQALQNLASAAELNLRTVYDAAAAGDRGLVRTLLDVANETLRKKMDVAWRQSDVFARFDWDNNRLTIVVGTFETGFEALSERSDGLRQFVALFAFLSKQGMKDRETVLLLDEAETHLHYDAQADLVQMLAKQDLARRVIYTTHSVGCLPEDLGLGIRLIEPVSETKSSINNTFWSRGIPGLSPVLIGMGAATMAFMPLRFSLLTEGAADMLLLPSLLRQAKDIDHLGFQIAPGLSEAGEGQIALLNNEGRRVLFLVDGDGGGDAIVSKLRGANVPENKIFKLSDALGSPCTVEDFVEKTVYVKAVNAELQKSGHAVSLDPATLPDTQRATAVKSWCKGQGIHVPGKVAVAYGILEQFPDVQLIDQHRVDALARFHEKLVESFNSKDSPALTPMGRG